MVLRRWRRRQKLPAIERENLIPLLVKLDMYDALVEGRLHCLFCEEVLTLDNLAGLYRRDNEIAVFCIRPGCAWTSLM
jgi:hypothetical protein